MKLPNILLFLTDDHGAWATGCYGNSEVQSPHLDRLAEQGARFQNAFTPCPVCSPARACLMTGRTPSQVGIHDYLSSKVRDNDWLADESTLFELLQSQNYFCGLTGKWHIGGETKPPRGVDWHVGTRPVEGSRFSETEYGELLNKTSPCGKKTEFLTDCALQFLDEAPGDQPFFLEVVYTATHSPYAGQEPELVAQYDNASFADIPEYSPHPWKDNEGRPEGDYQPGQLRPYYANYYAAVTDIDRHVGSILQKLEQQGRLDDTVVIYTSDHGCALGHHGFWGKGNSTRPLNMYETSLRVPLIIRHPASVPTGVVIEENVDHYDTFQAICRWGGVLPPERDYPGHDYGALLRGDADGWSDATFGEYGDLRMIRTPDWKLVRRYPDGPDDLFDLQNDPGETNNLARRSEYSAQQAGLLHRLEEWYSHHEDAAKSGLRVKQLPVHNGKEAWRDGVRETRLV